MKKFLKIFVVPVLLAVSIFAFAACGSAAGNDPANWKRVEVQGTYTLKELYDMEDEARNALRGKFIEVEFNFSSIALYDSQYDVTQISGEYSAEYGVLATVYCTVYKPYYEFDYKDGDTLIGSGYLIHSSNKNYYSLIPSDVRKK